MNLEIISISLTLIFGLFAVIIYILRRDRKYPGAITFMHEDTIGLFNSIVQNLDSLNILYEGAPVEQNLVLLKGYLLNSGAKDITPRMVSDCLKAKVPDGFRYLEGKIVSASPQVNANIVITSDTEMEFDLGMFRKEEHIKFETLVEVASGLESDDKKKNEPPNPARVLDSALEFTHRIADTRKIDRVELPHLDSSSSSYRIQKNRLWSSVANIIIAIVFFGILILLTGPVDTGKLYYHIKLEDGRSFDVKAFPYANGMIRLSTSDGWFGRSTYSEVVPQDVFFSEMDVEPIVKDEQVAYSNVFLFFMGLVVLASFISGVFAYSSIRKSRKLYEKLGISQS